MKRVMAGLSIAAGLTVPGLGHSGSFARLETLASQPGVFAGRAMDGALPAPTAADYGLGRALPPLPAGRAVAPAPKAPKSGEAPEPPEPYYHRLSGPEVALHGLLIGGYGVLTIAFPVVGAALLGVIGIGFLIGAATENEHRVGYALLGVTLIGTAAAAAFVPGAAPIVGAALIGAGAFTVIAGIAKTITDWKEPY